MSGRDALERLGQSTAEACLGVLEMFAAGKVKSARSRSSTTRRPPSTASPFRLAMDVSYVDGVTGGNSS